MKDEKQKEKTIYELGLHETLKVANSVGGTIEVTRCPGGWVFAFEYPGWRQSQIVFIPYNAEFVGINKVKVIKTK